MEGVSFSEEEVTSYNAGALPEQKSSITNLVIKMGLAKTAKEANIAMLVIIVSFTVIALVVWQLNSAPKVTPDMQRMQKWMQQGHAGRPPADFKG